MAHRAGGSWTSVGVRHDSVEPQVVLRARLLKASYRCADCASPAIRVHEHDYLAAEKWQHMVHTRSGFIGSTVRAHDKCPMDPSSAPSVVPPRAHGSVRLRLVHICNALHGGTGMPPWMEPCFKNSAVLTMPPLPPSPLCDRAEAHPLRRPCVRK